MKLNESGQDGRYKDQLLMGEGTQQGYMHEVRGLHCTTTITLPSPLRSHPSAKDILISPNRHIATCQSATSSCEAIRPAPLSSLERRYATMGSASNMWAFGSEMSRHWSQHHTGSLKERIGLYPAAGSGLHRGWQGPDTPSERYEQACLAPYATQRSILEGQACVD